MELFEAIHHRRSIRKYENRPVPDEVVKKILAAAMTAPSAGNAQPWQFVVVTDRERLDRAGDVHPYVGMAKSAPLGILVCGDTRLEKYPGFWPQDCAAATQNLLLAAHAEGLGAVWTGIYPMAERADKFAEIFGLPEGVVAFGFVPMGYPAQESRFEDRFKEERVHRDKW